MPETHVRQPPIVLNQEDSARLQRLALDALLTNPRVAGPLLEEVDRAAVLRAPEMTANRVGLGSWVQFVDDITGRPQRRRLVAAARPDAPEELSVLTPTGVALIGMSVGQSIVCSDRLGSERVLTILGVTRADSPPPVPNPRRRP